MSHQRVRTNSASDDGGGPGDKAPALSRPKRLLHLDWLRTQSVYNVVCGHAWWTAVDETKATGGTYLNCTPTCTAAAKESERMASPRGPRVASPGGLTGPTVRGRSACTDRPRGG